MTPERSLLPLCSTDRAACAQAASRLLEQTVEHDRRRARDLPHVAEGLVVDPAVAPPRRRLRVAIPVDERHGVELGVRQHEVEVVRRPRPWDCDDVEVGIPEVGGAEDPSCC